MHLARLFRVQGRQKAKNLSNTSTQKREHKRNTRKNQRLRDNGRLPGVLYGIDENRSVVKVNLTVDAKSVARELRTLGDGIQNTIFELRLRDTEGNLQTHAVLPRQIPLNPLTDAPMSINFLKYWPGQFVRIPLNYINHDQSIGLKRGCFLLRTSWFVECVVDSADPAHMPKALDVDLSGTEKDATHCVWIELFSLPMCARHVESPMTLWPR